MVLAFFDFFNTAYRKRFVSGHPFGMPLEANAFGGQNHLIENQPQYASKILTPSPLPLPGSEVLEFSSAHKSTIDQP